MVRPGMTEGTPADAAPESGRLDLNPGVNVGAAQFAHAPPPPGGMPSQSQLDDAQAEARHDASPASYDGPDKVEHKKTGAGLLLIGGVVVLILLALLFFLR